jgi:DNA-binding CsgD family transcriptional regulator
MSGISDEKILRWLLSLYRSAQETPPEQLKNETFEHLKELIPVSSGIWTAIDTRPGGGRDFLGMHLFQEPERLADELPGVNDQNRMAVDLAIAGLGRAHSFDALRMNPGPERAALRDYLAKYGHQNILLLIDGSPAGRKEAFSLYRGEPDDHFTPTEQRVLGVLAPHMSEAFAISLQRSGLPTDVRGSSLAGTRAIVQTNGVMVTCGEQFLRLMRRRWPYWYSGRIPFDLMRRLRLGVQTLETPDGPVVITVRWLGPYLLLQASASTARTLSARQAEIARLYTRDMTHRQIADAIGVAPATVRSSLRTVYVKLQVRNKPELLQALRRQPRGRESAAPPAADGMSILTDEVILP